MSAALFPDVFTGIFLVVVLAAIMSTVDSLLLLASSAIVRDIVQKAMGIQASQRTLSNLARGVTVVIGLVGLVVALTEPASIFYFVLFAWSGIACAFTPVVLCSLFWKRTTKLGAIAGMIGGFVVTVVWTIWFKERFYDLYEMIPGFIAGFVCTISVSLATDCDRDIADEVDSVRRAVGPVF
jgi:sodium/proline symporter